MKNLASVNNHLKFFLGFNMYERHKILYQSIGFHIKEHAAMEMVTNLITLSSAYILFGTLLEAIFFKLYNSSFHPFARILDTSECSKGISFQQ